MSHEHLDSPDQSPSQESNHRRRSRQPKPVEQYSPTQVHSTVPLNLQEPSLFEKLVESMLQQLSDQMRPTVNRHVGDLLAWNGAYYESEKRLEDKLRQIQDTEEGDQLLADEVDRLKEENEKLKEQLKLAQMDQGRG